MTLLLCCPGLFFLVLVDVEHGDVLVSVVFVSDCVGDVPV